MYNYQLVYKAVIWAFFGIRFWTEKVALIIVIGGPWSIDPVLGHTPIIGLGSRVTDLPYWEYQYNPLGGVSPPCAMKLMIYRCQWTSLVHRKQVDIVVKYPDIDVLHDMCQILGFNPWTTRSTAIWQTLQFIEMLKRSMTISESLMNQSVYKFIHIIIGCL